MVTWFAGLFYLPRLYVYHAQANDQISKDRFKIMERKLFWGYYDTWGSADNIIWSSIDRIPWHVPTGLKMKIILVFLLVLYHFWCGVLLEKFKSDTNT